MMATLTNNSAIGTAYTTELLEALCRERDEPDWLVDRRKAALEAASRLPWPTLRDEEWRRTDIRPLKLSQFPPAPDTSISEGTRAHFASLWNTLSGHYGAGLEHIDGSLSRGPDPSKLPAGVIYTSLAEAVRQHPELLRRYLSTKAVLPDEDIFSALHAAFWTSGALLYVPRGVKLEQPLFHLMGLSPEGRLELNHTLVILEEGAEATLVQESAAANRAGSPALHMGAVELLVGPHARLRFVNIQNWDNSTWHLSRERAVVDRDAAIQWTVGGLGSHLAKVNQEVKLVGPGARAQVNGVMFTTGRQNLTYITRQDHAADHTTSDLLYKAGLKDDSRVVWRGMIRVEKEAQKTDAYQKNDNLLLSHSARADSIPGLEINANDVRCTHGATAGRVDDDMIFYSQSRGISKETAIRLIVEGFFANVYDRITLEPVQETLRLAVAAKLEL